MTNVSVSRTIKAPARKVWAMISEWGGTHEWIPGVGPVTVEGAGVGALRSADLDPATGFSGRICERLESFDDQAMRFSYCVVGDSPIPIANYLAEMQVRATGNGSTEVTWSSSWNASGAISEADLKTAFDGLYAISLDNVAAALE